MPEIRPYLAAGTVSIAPMTVGSGVSNKLLEAFATGTPIVATPMACGDLPVKDGEHLFIADSPGAFAQKVIKLLKDETSRRNIAGRALKLVREKYDWRVVTKTMESVLLDASKQRAGSQRTESAEVLASR